MMLQKGGKLPALEASKPLPAGRAAQLAGRYKEGNHAYELVEQNAKLYMTSWNGALTVEVRSLGDSLVIDDRLAKGGEPLRIDERKSSPIVSPPIRPLDGAT